MIAALEIQNCKSSTNSGRHAFIIFMKRIEHQNRGLKLLILLLLNISIATISTGQNIQINEILAANASLDYDDFFQYEDWVELYNGGGIQDLAGYYLTDDPDSLDKWIFPLDDPGLTTILPNGHIRIWCDKDEQQGSDHANFKLSGEGETVYFVGTDGMTIIDSVSFGIQQDNISFGATCDGCAEWQYFNSPTPDAPNAETILSPSLLYINEIQVANTSTVADEMNEFDAWVELFNPNDDQVNLAGYTLQINGVSHTFENIEPWLTTIPSNGFQIFWFDNEVEQGSNHVALSPSEGGTLNLIGNDGTLIDSAEWNDNLAEDQSWGREQDGSLNWTVFDFPTARATNALQIIQPGSLVINEVQSDNFITYADNTGEYDDWIEIYNFGNTPIDIANYYLTDRLDQPQKWLIPSCNCDSTIIPPSGFVMIFADEDGSQGWNHANFKVSSNGESLALRSPDGFTIADAIDVPALSLGKSFGRSYDAGLPWIAFNLPTPNASNGTGNGLGTNPILNWKEPYPNPIRNGQLLQAASAGRIFNANGQQVMHWSSIRSEGIEMNLPAGIYFIQWTDAHAAARKPSKLFVLD